MKRPTRIFLDPRDLITDGHLQWTLPHESDMRFETMRQTAKRECVDIGFFIYE